MAENKTAVPPQCSINKYLTTDMHRVLVKMRAVEEDDELTHATPGGWWIGDERIDGRTCYRLLRLCLIHRSQDSRDDYERFTLNEEGQRVLDDPAYEPMIIAALETRQHG